jgi:hypothetical protein
MPDYAVRVNSLQYNILCHFVAEAIINEPKLLLTAGKKIQQYSTLIMYNWMSSDETGLSSYHKG